MARDQPVSVFAARVRALRQHPEIWRAVPNGLTLPQTEDNEGAAALWREVVAFLKEYGLVGRTTFWKDVNVPKLIAAVRELERQCPELTASELKAPRGEPL